MIRTLYFILSILLLTISSKSQNKDTILLMNGNTVVEKVIDTLIGAVTIVNPANTLEKLHYEYDEIYCVKYAVGFTDYYYTQDTMKGNYFTRDEMLYYINGERDARKGFRARGALIGAGVVGLASGGVGLFFAPIFPYGYMALTGVPKVRIKHKTISNPNYIDHDPYILGY